MLKSYSELAEQRRLEEEQEKKAAMKKAGKNISLYGFCIIMAFIYTTFKPNLLNAVLISGAVGVLLDIFVKLFYVK